MNAGYSCFYYCTQCLTNCFLVISPTKLRRFWWNLVQRFPNKFAAKRCEYFLLYLNVSLHYLVKLEMLIVHDVLLSSCYRKRLQNLNIHLCLHTKCRIKRNKQIRNKKDRTSVLDALLAWQDSIIGEMSSRLWLLDANLQMHRPTLPPKGSAI